MTEENLHSLDESIINFNLEIIDYRQLVIKIIVIINRRFHMEIFLIEDLSVISISSSLSYPITFISFDL
jgi:hypothetical protein